MSGVVLGGVVEVVGSNLARGKIFTASISSVDSLSLSLSIYISPVASATVRFKAFFVVYSLFVAPIGCGDFVLDPCIAGSNDLK